MKPGVHYRKIIVGAVRTAILGVLVAATAFAQTADPLPSWNAGPARQAIVDFVRATTDPASAQFVPPA